MNWARIRMYFIVLWMIGNCGLFLFRSNSYSDHLGVLRGCTTSTSEENVRGRKQKKNPKQNENISILPLFASPHLKQRREAGGSAILLTPCVYSSQAFAGHLNSPPHPPETQETPSKGLLVSRGLMTWHLSSRSPCWSPSSYGPQPWALQLPRRRSLCSAFQCYGCPTVISINVVDYYCCYYITFRCNCIFMKENLRLRVCVSEWERERERGSLPHKCVRESEKIGAPCNPKTCLSQTYLYIHDVMRIVRRPQWKVPSIKIRSLYYWSLLLIYLIFCFFLQYFIDLVLVWSCRIDSIDWQGHKHRRENVRCVCVCVCVCVLRCLAAV